MSWDGINPVLISRSVRTVLFHGQNGTYGAPDDGRKGRPKHVEHTCSC